MIGLAAITYVKRLCRCLCAAKQGNVLKKLMRCAVHAEPCKTCICIICQMWF